VVVRGIITGLLRVTEQPLDTFAVAPENPPVHRVGNAVGFEKARDVRAAGDGIETMLSLRDALPDLAMPPALVVNHRSAMVVSPSVKVFGNWFKRRCREAGVASDLSAHGLRKLGAQRCAEAGAR